MTIQRYNHWKLAASLVSGAAVFSFGFNSWASTWFPKPPTSLPDRIAHEDSTLVLPGVHAWGRADTYKRDHATINYAEHSRKNWPRFDRRDDDDDNKYYNFVNKNEE